MLSRHLTFEAIGTRWELVVSESLNDDAWSQLLQSIDQRIQLFDTHYSRFRGDSTVTQMSHTAGTYDLPTDGYKLLQFYDRLYKATDGKVTPLIGQTISDAGYDASYSFTLQPLSQPPAWDDILSYDEHQLTMHAPALLDFGAAGKGYLVDLIGEIMKNTGLKNFTINAGGDVLQRSSSNTGLQIGLENPLEVSEAIGIATITNQSLCASAGSKRAWGKFTHIIDPQKLESPSDILATWVVAADTMTADGLATALFFTHPDALRREFSFDYAIEHRDTSLQHSPHFSVELFKPEHHENHR